MATVGRGLFEEFIVDTEQVSQITRAKLKIERMHEVSIKLNEVAKLDSKESKQWIRVEGDVGDRKNARDYIIAMCQPSETYQLPFDANCQDYLHEENLEEIEKQTNACIEIDDLNMLLIKGSDLAVTLAISSLENIIGHSKIEVDGVGAPSTSSRHGAQGGPPDWEKRLDSTFLRALSKSSDGSCKFDDYHNSSTEVKMTILKCLNNDYSENVDENELFDNNKKQITAGSTPLQPITIYGDDDDIDVKDGDSYVENKKSLLGIDNISEQLTDTIISPRKETSTKKCETEEVKFLRNFGNSAGYSDEIIDEGLLYADDKTAPCDFLDILTQLKNSKKNDDAETPMDTSEETKNESENKSFSFPPPPQIPCDENGQSRRSLPKEYKQTLFKHVMAEQEGKMSVNELKKLNEERQKILKEQFGSPSKETDPPPKESKSRRKRRNRKKANKKVGQNNNLVSGDSNIEDEDETCVLKVFDSSSDDDCMITEVQEPVAPVFVQPPRPITNYPETQRQPTNPQNYTRNNLPETQRQPTNPQNYTRNNLPVNRPQQNQQLSGSRELRYIVIDGSNVAMHHGRGKIFSCQGIRICIDYFLKRGHSKITCFVPAWRRYRPRPQNPISDQELLVELNEKGWLEFTPARRIENKLISSYDDRYVVELTETVDGIIVSNDQYRDLMVEKSSWKRIIEERLLQYNFVGDNFMVPHDPLGQYGPKLDEFLSKPSKQPSPHRKRHLSPPETSGQSYWNQPPPSLLDLPLPVGQHPGANWQQQVPGTQFQNQLQPQNQPNNRYTWNNQGQTQNRFQAKNQGHFQIPVRYQAQNVSGQNRFTNPTNQKKKGGSNPWQHDKISKPNRTLEKTQDIIKALTDIFPDAADKILAVVENHPGETDMTRLSNYVISAVGD